MGNKFAAKLRASRGFTLVELMVSLVILVLVAGAIAMGVTTTLRVYRDITSCSEASILASTLSNALNQELRTASNVQVDEDTGQVTFICSYGSGVRVSCEEPGYQGYAVMVTVDNVYPLLSPVAYTNDLKAQVDLTYAVPEGYDSPLFQVEIRIIGPDGTCYHTAGYSVAVLNP